MNEIIPIPLFVPDFKLLRADAVWVTIANWAAGLNERYGRADVVVGNSKYTAEQIRSRCFQPDLGKVINKKPSPFRQSFVGKLGETFAKDIRWYFENQKALQVDLDKYFNAPFIWQHHDLFQIRGLKFAQELGIPSVLFVDAPYVWESRKWGVTRLGWEWFSSKRGDALPCKMADVVLVVSEEVKQAVMSLGVKESKILITPCTVAPEKYSEVNGKKVRTILGIDNDFVLGWVGSFRKFHSLDLLIEAFQKVKRDLSNVKLLLVGDGPERLRIQERVNSNGLNDDVIFTGNVPHNEVPDYISSFNLGILPSHANEGFHYSPLKLREYFAAGVPVLGSAVGDVKNVIEKSGGGWLVPAGDHQAIANKTLNLFKNKDKLFEASSKAKGYAIQEMGIQKQIQMVENFLEDRL